MKIEPADVIVGIITLACLILIGVFDQPQAWGGLLVVFIGYLGLNISRLLAFGKKVPEMIEDPLARLESIARQSSWFALDNSEKADSLVASQAALWVFLGRGETMDEVLSDPDCGRIVATTRAADDLFGYAEGMLVGKSLKTLIPSRFHIHHDTFFANYSLDPQPRQMGGQRAELPGVRKDGTEILLEIGLHPKFIRMRQLALATLATRRA